MRALPTPAVLLVHSVHLALLVSTGCAIDTSAVPPEGAVDSSLSDSGSSDGSSEGMVPDSESRDVGLPDGGSCTEWSPRHFQPCAIPVSDRAVNLIMDGVYDTDRGSFLIGGIEVTVPTAVIDQGEGDARLISVASFRIASGARLRVVGSLPLIIASWDTLSIQGELDVSSERGGDTGAGARGSACSGERPGEDGVSGTGGGGGGGFGGAGGNGGQADSNNIDGMTLAGGRGGGDIAVPTIVRGGCPGADSGAAAAGAVGARGAGGGAIQLSALGAISVSGGVFAGGAGGTGGPSSSAAGGGGGGSGGYIGLDASIVTVTGVLAANGGGGGEGTDLSSTGADGEDARRDESPATGGGGGTSLATDGGPGGSGATLDGASVSGVEVGGGGGGGGGVGFVLVWSRDFTSSSALISPPAMPMP